jgi:hypothetical protein
MPKTQEKFTKQHFKKILQCKELCCIIFTHATNKNKITITQLEFQCVGERACRTQNLKTQG